MFKIRKNYKQHDLFRSTVHCALLQLHDVISSHKRIYGEVSHIIQSKRRQLEGCVGGFVGTL